MNVFAQLYYRLRKAPKAVRLYLILAGPGLVVMVAENDAGYHELRSDGREA